MKTIQVHASRQYDVCIGKNILKDLGGHIRSLFSPETRIAVVTDDTVNRLYGDALERALDGIDFVKFVFPAGESSKSISTYSALLEFLEQLDFTPKPHIHSEIFEIIMEETAPFLNGDKSLEEAVHVVQNRVSALVQESL